MYLGSASSLERTKSLSALQSRNVCRLASEQQDREISIKESNMFGADSALHQNFADMTKQWLYSQAFRAKTSKRELRVLML